MDDRERILAADLTKAEVANAAVAPKALTAVGAAIVRITADGGYDRQEVYDAASCVDANVVTPPRKDAVPSRDPTLAQWGVVVSPP